MQAKKVKLIVAVLLSSVLVSCRKIPVNVEPEAGKEVLVLSKKNVEEEDIEPHFSNITIVKNEFLPLDDGGYELKLVEFVTKLFEILHTEWLSEKLSLLELH